MVSHRHITVNGKIVNIPSYQVKIGDVIAVKESSKTSSGIKTLIAKNSNRPAPEWLELDQEAYSGKVLALATKKDIDYEVKENLIVEYYSK